MECYLDLVDFYDDYEQKRIDFPVFVKPVERSASININKVHSIEDLEALFSRYDDLMIQQFMDGVEYGVDAYIGLYSQELVSIFIKEKINMRAGETDKSVSVRNEEILKNVRDFLEVTDYLGIIDIDFFKVEGKYHISKANPRLGDGYPHGYELGMNIPGQIINNLQGKKNPNQLNNYET